MATGDPGKLVEFVFSARRWTPDRVVWRKSKWALILFYLVILAGFLVMAWVLWVKGTSGGAAWLVGGICTLLVVSIVWTLREDRALVFHRVPRNIELVGRSWGKDQGRQFKLAGELRVLRPSSGSSNAMLELQTDDEFTLRCFLGFHAFGALGKGQIQRLVNLGDTLESMTEGRLRFVRRDPDKHGRSKI